MHPLKLVGPGGVGGMGGAGGGPISRGNVPFWCSSLVHPISYALLHPPADGCAADSKRCAGTAAHSVVLVLVLVRVLVLCLGPFGGPGC